MRDMCPPLDNIPNDIGLPGLTIPSLSVTILSKSLSNPHACKQDINNCAISMVRLLSQYGSEVGRSAFSSCGLCSRGVGGLEFVILGGAGLGGAGRLGFFLLVLGLNPSSALAWILLPTASALFFTLARKPKRKFYNHFQQKNLKLATYSEPLHL